MTTRFFEKFSSDLSNLLLDNDEYNVVIEVGKTPNNQIFKAHSIILNSRCSYFKNKLSNIAYENNIKKINVNISVKIFDIILKFFPLSENYLVFILKFDYLQIDEILIWDYVIKWGIAQNPSLSPNPDQWSDADISTLKNTLKNCLPLIRYFQISGKDIFDKIRPYQKIFDQSLWDDIETKLMAPNREVIKSAVLPPRNFLSISIPSRTTSMPEFNAFELKQRGESHFMMGRYKLALIDLSKSLEIIPNNSHTLTSRGVTYHMLDKYEEALIDLNKSLEIDPNDAFTLRNRGATYYLIGKYDEAIVDLNKSLDLDPDNAFALDNRGATYYMLNKYDEALADLNKSLELEPNDEFTLRVRGATYLMLEKYDEAIADLTNSLNIGPNNVFALGNRGLIYLMMGKYNESFIDLAKALEIEPYNSWTLKVHSKLISIMKKKQNAQ
ncbi:hypothetical protein C2G38_2035838 [Gigaspora rosea]|uniref:BTB domain-containing protein n=1 Tax=Gigaspora rosea TaxID=44941 RepID=A0A397VCH8_9GLOM|nr:hypothetical protein C2G38_2035838 [Gigaspora rosea]